jgi:hypothetical protein
MTTTSQTSFLAEPRGEHRLSPRVLAYVAEATRDALFDLITRRFMESGLTKAGLAKRLGKDASQVTRLLSLPGNWTIDTCAELLFAIDGSMLSVNGYKPLSQRPHNHRGIVCLNFDDVPHSHSPSTSRNTVFVGQTPALSIPSTSQTRVPELAL